MTLWRRLRRVAFLLAVHAVHVFILLLPSLVVGGLSGIDAVLGCFALGIAIASLLESLLVRERFDPSSVAIRDRAAMRVAQAVGVCLLAAFWSAQVERLARGEASITLEAAGATLLAVGILLRALAIRALGPRFVSDIRVSGPIVRDGIYARLRHPSEIGLLLIAVGGPMLLGSPMIAAVVGLILLPISIWRMRREDAALFHPGSNALP